MQDSDFDAGRSSENQQWFATTHWSVVLAAKQGDCSTAAAALERLCRTYWPPLYAYIRRENGKFRSFLLAFLKNFLSERRRCEHERSNAHS